MTGARQVCWTSGVYLITTIWIGLTSINVGPGGAVNNNLRGIFFQTTGDLNSIANIQFGTGQGDNLVFTIPAMFREGSTDQSTRASYKYLHFCFTSVPYCCL